MTKIGQLLTGLIAVGAFALVGVSFLPSTQTPAHAQNSCDNPPFDTARISEVWDLTDFCTFQEGIFDEIISGGVGRDGIPPIDNPTFDSIDVANQWLQPQSPVLSVEIDGEARAYPLAILTRHEIVNDEIAGRSLAVTFCPLCNSAIVFDRTVEGEVLRFGVSGLLRNSDLIMWDDVTQSWWQQFTGVGIVGQYTDYELDIVPSLLIGYGTFVEQYPDGIVLSTNGRSYETNPYVGYDTNSRPFLFQDEIDERLFATERVLGYWDGDGAIAYPFETLTEERVVNDTFNDANLLVVWQEGKASALDGRNIDESRDVGMAALYERDVDEQTLTFSLEDGQLVDAETGSTWNFFGQAVDGELAGTQLRQVNAFPHFWFAWAAFRDDTVVYGQDS